MKKVNYLSIMFIFSLVTLLTSCNSSSENLNDVQQSYEQHAYAEYQTSKASATNSFTLTETEYNIIASGKMDVSNFSSAKSYTGTSNSFQPQTPTIYEPVQAAQVVVCEDHGNEYHCYELTSFEKCPSIYSSIPNVECIEF